ncbi:MAG: hypothetical protein AAFP19_03395 [Bacteroidota bacterium]
MQELSGKISDIELKVRQLALKLERLQNENIALLNENKKLKSDLLTQTQKAGELEQKCALVQAALERKRETDPESSKKLRKEIAQYVKEIDQCMEWLQNS